MALNLRRILTRFALAFLRGLRFFMYGVGTALKPVRRSLGFVLGLLKRGLLLPIYAFYVLLRIRLSRLFSSARGIFFLLFTNRFVFHAVLLLISLVTIASQLQPKNATAFDVGQHSMLYTLVTDGRDEVVEETARPQAVVKNASYLGPATLTVLPSVDYDYEGDVDQPLADLTVPGSIAAQPGIDDLGGSTPVVPTRTQTEIYTVQDGDTVASIARRFGVNVGTITWANNLNARASIKPGDSLKIPPVSGVLHVVKKGDTVAKIANLYGADADQIYAANNLTPGQTLALGQELIVPGGTPPATPVVKPKPPVAVRPDVPVSSIPGKTLDQYQELTTTQPDTRLKPPDEEVAAPAKLIWPTVQHLINQYYGWRHTGVDINGDYTDPIYAAADGVVTTAGWNSGGYGLMILIDHQNGYVTRYGHASKLFVQVGDHVKQGQVIAMVGTTGRSTGTHLHFEVYVNGKRTNPLAYVRP